MAKGPIRRASSTDVSSPHWMLADRGLGIMEAVTSSILSPPRSLEPMLATLGLQATTWLNLRAQPTGRGPTLPFRRRQQLSDQRLGFSVKAASIGNRPLI